MTGKEKSVYLELLRIIAILFVIYNHTGDYGNYLFLEMPPASFSYWMDLIISIACQCCVPVFFAVSGALLLAGRDDSIRKLLKRVLRILFLLIFYSFLYYIHDVHKFSLDFSWREFLEKLYSQSLKYHLWYLYAYIAYLLTVPFLKAMVKTLKDKYFIFMFVTAVLLNGLIPVTEYLIFKGQISLSPYKSGVWYAVNTVLCPCIGYYIHNRMDRDFMKKCIIPIWALNLAGLGMSAYMTDYYGRINGIHDQSISSPFFACFVAVNCAALFMTFKLCDGTVKGISARVITVIGSAVFGIYLLHVFVVMSDWYYQTMDILRSSLNYMLAAWCMVLMIFVISGAATLLISLIPYLRCLVGYRYKR